MSAVGEVSASRRTEARRRYRSRGPFRSGVRRDLARPHRRRRAPLLRVRPEARLPLPPDRRTGHRAARSGRSYGPYTGTCFASTRDRDIEYSSHAIGSRTLRVLGPKSGRWPEEKHELFRAWGTLWNGTGWTPCCTTSGERPHHSSNRVRRTSDELAPRLRQLAARSMLNEQIATERLNPTLTRSVWNNPFHKVFVLRPRTVWEFKDGPIAIEHRIPDLWLPRL